MRDAKNGRVVYRHPGMSVRAGAFLYASLCWKGGYLWLLHYVPLLPLFLPFDRCTAIAKLTPQQSQRPVQPCSDQFAG